MNGLRWAPDELLERLSYDRKTYLVASLKGFLLIRDEPGLGFCRIGTYYTSAVRDLEDAGLISIGAPSDELPDYPHEESDIPLCSAVELTETGRARVAELAS